MKELVFLKLGGSAITDKTRGAMAREDVIHSIAQQVRTALDRNQELSILLGHGSGSFGHFTANKFGYGQPGNWLAYAETGASAARLNRLVADIFLAEGVLVVTMQPSASARCRDGKLVQLEVGPLRTALEHRLLPLVYGDVGFDDTREMTIISTEMIFAYLAPVLKPTRILLGGIVDGAFTADPLQNPSAQLIREITPARAAEVESQLRGSHGFDVTGGMINKVKTMLALVERQPEISVRLLSATREGVITRALLDAGTAEGTLIHAG